MLLSGDLGFLLHACVEVSKLLLSTLMKSTKVSLSLSFLFSLFGPELEFSLFKCLLGTNLIHSSLAILSTLLLLTQTLHFALFLFLNSLCFTCISFLTLNLLTIVLCNLFISLSLSLTSRNFLLFSIFIGNPDFFVHNLELLPLGGKFLSIFSFDLLDVGEKLCLLHLGLVLQLLAVDLSIRDLVDEDLGTALSRLRRALFSCHLLLDCLQALDFQHHIKFLLLLDPVLFEQSVLFQLFVTYSHNLRLEHKLIHALHIVIALIDSILHVSQEWMAIVILHLDLEWGISLTLSILRLHLLFTRIGSSHLLLLLLVHHGLLALYLSPVLVNHLLTDALEVVLLDDRDLGVVLLSYGELRSNVL